MRLKVVAYTDASMVGGAEISLGNLLRCLDGRIDVTLLGVEQWVLEHIAATRPGTSIQLVRRVRNKADVAGIAAHMRAIWRLRPHILHANLNTPWSSSYAVAAALALPGIKVIAVEHLPIPTESAQQRLLKRLASRRLHAHVAVGERSARAVEELVGLSLGSVRTIHNGVLDEVPKARETRTPPLVLGSLGRLDRQKGYDVLLRAVAPLPDVEVRLVGGGPERGALEALARELGMEDRLRITEWSPEPREHLPAFDVFVLPSRFEGFPLSILEAMLAGLPVIATPVGSVSESVLDGETGLLVPPEEPGPLTIAIEQLAADAELRRSMGAAGREYAEKLFLAGDMARAFESLYGELTRS